jgi:HSP20 family protein
VKEFNSRHEAVWRLLQGLLSKEVKMALKDLIPWNRGRDVAVRRAEAPSPFLSLQREMNRLFDEAFRGFDLAPFGLSDRLFGGASWPNIEVAETGKEIKVTAELPGLDEKDIDVHLANGVLTISGAKHAETEDKDRLFSERYYGRFVRRIPLQDVDENKVTATFKKGLLTVTLPKSALVIDRVKRIQIQSK